MVSQDQPKQKRQPAPKQGGQQSSEPRAKKPQTPDPFADTKEATPEEQQQYDDLVSRALMFISDSRHPAETAKAPPEKAKELKQTLKAPRDAVIDSLRAGGQSVKKALGRTASDVIWAITNNAKRQGVKYDGDVVFAAGEEIISALYEMGKAAKVFENTPKDGSKEESELLGEALLEGARHFGQRMKDTGQIDEHRPEAMKTMKEQIDREAEEGQLDNFNPAEDMNPEMARAVAAASQGDERAIQALMQRRGGQGGA